MRLRGLGLCLAISAAPLGMTANAQTLANVKAAPAVVEEDTSAAARRINYGFGLRTWAQARQKAAQPAAVGAEAAPPQGGPDAHIKGFFAPQVTWPLVMIHATLTPDGRVFMNGTRGERKGQLIFDVWDPRPGGGHLVLPNETRTDVFCSGQSLLPVNGTLLLTGGTTQRDGVGGIGIPSTTIFDPNANTMNVGPSMVYDRWYPSVIPLANGDRLIAGGRETSSIYSPTPEVFAQNGSWRTLAGATSDAAFGKVAANWYYPQAYQMPNDPNKVFVLGHNGKMFYLNLVGDGSITQLAKTTLSSNNRLPTAMFAPGRLLSIRNSAKVVVVNINGAEPVTTPTGDISQVRYYSSATVLADGKVLVTGGSSAGNVLGDGVALAAEIWDPATGSWTLGARAAIPRLYHSNALLLPDGTVVTGGGGRPGPVTNLNAEMYYPPYLFDTNGAPASRPSLVDAPTALSLSKPTDREFTATVAAGDRITRVTMLHAGSATHNIDLEQRFQQLSFTQSSSTTLKITAPQNPNYTVPGYYLLFVFNEFDVPSEAKIVKIVS